MVQIAHGWELDVERGPDWLFIRPLGAPPDLVQSRFADEVWNLLEQNRLRRVVLDLDQLPHLTSSLIGQFVMLQKRLHQTGGLLRLCSLSNVNQEVLDNCRLSGRLPCYASRGDAVMGQLVRKPR